MTSQRFSVTVVKRPKGLVVVQVPFDPDAIWGAKPEHHVHGTINGMDVRAAVEAIGDGEFGFRIGPAWREPCGIEPGDVVDVVLEPEGPQRGDLAADVAGALEAKPRAGEFFDSLATFYRTGYLRWIDATKRSPERRAQRIAEMVSLLEQGVKQRPR